jgi:hypothetical protein
MKDALYLYLSTDTFSRILDTYEIKKWRTRKRPFLTEEYAKVRLAWVRERQDWHDE